MNMYVYCYYRRKVGCYTQPILNAFDTDMIVELTQRSFIANKGSEEHLLQGQCDLYYLGTFDDETASFELLNKPEFLCSYVDREEEIKTDGKEDSVNQSVQES